MRLKKGNRLPVGIGKQFMVPEMLLNLLNQPAADALFPVIKQHRRIHDQGPGLVVGQCSYGSHNLVPIQRVNRIAAIPESFPCLFLIPVIPDTNRSRKNLADLIEIHVPVVRIPDTHDYSSQRINVFSALLTRISITVVITPTVTMPARTQR